MGPRKRDGKVVNNNIKNIQQKKGKKKICTKNLPLIRIEIPSKTDTKNSKSRVVTAQPLTSQMLLTKKNNTNNVRSAKPFLRSSTALRNQANAENMDSKCKPTVQSSVAEATPQKASTTDDAPAKPAVKRKPTPRRQLNKTTSEMNKSQDTYRTDNDSDDFALEEPNRPKIRKTKKWKENSVTQDTNAATRGNNRLNFTQRRLTRSNILTPKRGGLSRRKSIVNDQKDRFREVEKEIKRHVKFKGYTRSTKLCTLLHILLYSPINIFLYSNTVRAKVELLLKKLFSLKSSPVDCLVVS